MLQVFFHKLKSNFSIRRSTKKTVEEVFDVYRSAEIPVQLLQHAISKLQRPDQQWRALQKNRLWKMSVAQQMKERAFKNNLEDIFDVAHHKALQMLRRNQKRQFLKNQRAKRQREASEERSETSVNEEVLMLGCGSQSGIVENEGIYGSLFLSPNSSIYVIRYVFRIFLFYIRL